MPDATTPTTVTKEPDPAGLNVEVADAITVYAGRFAGIRGPDHATTQGYVDSYAAEAGMFFAGLMESAGGLTEILGATSDNDIPTAGIYLLPQKLKRVVVTGAASRGDILRPVYCTDNQTLTLTRPTLGVPIGVILEWHTSTTVDVLLFGAAVQAAIDLAGAGQELIYLGSIDFGTTIDGDLKTGIPMPFHGELLEVFTITELVLVGASGTILLNFEIGGTNVTGGVITVATATQATLGTKSVGTAITAAAVFHEGDLLDIEGASAGGTRTTGRVGIYAIVAKKLGA